MSEPMTDTNQEVRKTPAVSDAMVEVALDAFCENIDGTFAVLDRLHVLSFQSQMRRMRAAITAALASALASAPPPAVPDAVGVRVKGEAKARAKQALYSLRFSGQPMSSMFSADELGLITDTVRAALSSVEPTPSPEPQASNAGAEEALRSCIEVIDEYLAYRHDGDPDREDARIMGEMEINRFGRDGRLERARAALTTPEPQTGKRDRKVVADPERIWLQNAKDGAAGDDGRLWCAEKIWPDDALDGEPAEYVRVNLFEAERTAREAAESERDDLATEIEDLKQVPWPKWVEEVLAVIRKRSGYDGYDDHSDGVNLPDELDECMSELEREAEAQTQIARADREVERHKSAADHYREQADEYRPKLAEAERRLAEVEERAREDERDRLYELSFSAPGSIAIVTPGFILDCGDTMLPADRAALRAKPEAHILVGKEGEQ